MSGKNSMFLALTKAVVVSTGLLMAAMAVHATENAQERRNARDTKQESRQSAHQEKVDCRQANQKSNAACRQEKRDDKHEGRQDSRAVRAGAPTKN